MNKVVLIGRVSKDIDLKFLPGDGKAIAKFTLAVTRKYKKDEADFINCTIFGKQAETIAQYVTKGQQLAVEGRIQTGSYQKDDNTKVYTTDIIVDGFDFIGGSKNTSDYKSNNDIEDVFNNAGVDFTPVNNDDMPF